MKVAVICNDVFHPASVVREGIAALGASEVEWDFFEDTSEWPASRFGMYDVIVLSKGNSKSIDDRSPWLTEAVQQGFVEYVEGGRGLLVIHSGLVGYRDQPVFCALVGGVFTHHPEQCDVAVEGAGVRFTERDEHYFVETFGDPDAYLTSTSTNGVQPAGWRRHQGKGRVCVLTPGHNLGVWLNLEYRRQILDALDWCGGRDGSR